MHQVGFIYKKGKYSLKIKPQWRTLTWNTCSTIFCKLLHSQILGWTVMKYAKHSHNDHHLNSQQRYCSRQKSSVPVPLSISAFFFVHDNKPLFWARLQNWEKRLLILWCPSVRMGQLGTLWTELHETGYLFFGNLSSKFKVSLKSDKNNAHFTWRPIYIFDCISLNFLRMTNVTDKCYK